MNHLRAVFRLSPIVALITIVLVAPAAPQNIFALSCSELWQQRNGIFKAAGYCFHTPRAIRAFGNAGCAYDSEEDVPLSERDRQVINTIKQVERMKGCS
jgi:YARHG domain